MPLTRMNICGRCAASYDVRGPGNGGLKMTNGPQTPTDQPQARTSLEALTNCCNGRIGRRLLEMAAQNETIASIVRPTGVEVLRQVQEAGAIADFYTQCCWGRPLE
jgi:hypothetical protein